GDTRTLFTTLAMPVMTRLRMQDREVLDTLVESGVARSRAHAKPLKLEGSPSTRDCRSRRPRTSPLTLA
ncbi:MAG: hypothetical protein LC722_06645, partial [Actinobacteria bacterium]|nr:hypothetical protein [Actinomycetota bacterium]